MPDTADRGRQTPDPGTALRLAAERYLLATRAIHETHASTDVHGHGGMAGAAMTDHCAWECGATGIRYVNMGDGKLTRIVEPAPHALALTEWHNAEAALIEALRYPDQWPGGDVRSSGWWSGH